MDLAQRVDRVPDLALGPSAARASRFETLLAPGAGAAAVAAAVGAGAALRCASWCRPGGGRGALSTSRFGACRASVSKHSSRAAWSAIRAHVSSAEAVSPEPCAIAMPPIKSETTPAVLHPCFMFSEFVGEPVARVDEVKHRVTGIDKAAARAKPVRA